MEGEGSFLLSSSVQPPMQVARATGRYAPSPWVLLDSRAYFAGRENATTAEAAVTSTGRTIKVTFCLADPPAVSHLCVHGADLQRQDFTTEPLVLFSAKDLVLLRFSFTRRDDSSLADYLVYKAGRGNTPPSLTTIPRTPPGTTIESFHLCVLPFDDGDGFLLANLSMRKLRTDYKLHVFSSRTGKWTTRRLRLRVPPPVREADLPSPFLDKVVALGGGGVVGWVDLCRGIVSCNVFDDKNPVLSFIPIPPPMVGVGGRTRGDPRQVRDVTCCSNGGYIKFVELDHRVCGGGWELRTWRRHTSWDHWHQGHTLDMDDISAHNLDSQLWDAQAGRWALGNMITAYPILGIHGDGDVVYIMSKATSLDNHAWVLAVDLANKTVDALVQVSSERLRFFNPRFLICEFSEYLNSTSQGSACVVAQGSSHGPSYLRMSLHPNLTSQGSGRVYLVNAQLADPIVVVNTDDEQLPLSTGPIVPPRPSLPSRTCNSTHFEKLF